jgi:outer membrane lipoprotein carrier protein
MIADGKNLWFYDRDLEQVSVKPATSALTATPAGLLSGEGNIRELFTVAPAGRKDGLDWVLVTPKENDADFREARLAFGKSELKRMVLKDKLGQTVRLDFETSERNPPVAEAEVNFIPPAGADVIGTPAK